MPIQVQTAVNAAFKGTVDHEIHAAKAGEQISFHPVSAAMGEKVMLFNYSNISYRVMNVEIEYLPMDIFLSRTATICFKPISKIFRFIFQLHNPGP